MDQLLHPLTASNAFLSVPTDSSGCGNLSSASASLALTLLFLLLSFFCPTQICEYPYNPFQWSGTPASILAVFCENCCIYRCILDTSMERDVLHVHLLLHLLEPLLFLPFLLLTTVPFYRYTHMVYPFAFRRVLKLFLVLDYY